jgi:hypothetical protein
MPLPSVTVTAAFTLLNSDNGIILDDPVRGVLDSTYVLGGDLPTDISDFVQTVNVRRGRSGVLEAIPAGTATLTLDDQARTFDSLNAASPYAGNIAPGKRITVAVDGITIFDGRASNWQNDYRANAGASVTLAVEDSLAALGRRVLNAHTATAQLAGARVGAVLDRPEIAFGANRAIDAGGSTLQADAVSQDTNALGYLQLVAGSDSGRVFAARDGVLTFKDRASVASTDAVVTFADDGSGVDFEAVRRSDAARSLYNRVTVQRAGGVAQTVDNPASINVYDIRTLSVSGVLLNTDADALALANYLLGLFAQPEQRIEAVTVNVTTLPTAALRSAMVALDLAQIVRFTWTPLGVGAAIDRYCIVESIEHAIGPYRHTMTVGLSEVTSRSPFTLDDAVLGVLDGPGVLIY